MNYITIPLTGQALVNYLNQVRHDIEQAYKRPYQNRQLIALLEAELMDVGYVYHPEKGLRKVAQS